MSPFDLEKISPLKDRVTRWSSFTSVISPIFDTVSSWQKSETRYGFTPYCPAYESSEPTFAAWNNRNFVLGRAQALQWVMLSKSGVPEGTRIVFNVTVHRPGYLCFTGSSLHKPPQSLRSIESQDNKQDPSKQQYSQSKARTTRTSHPCTSVLPLAAADTTNHGSAVFTHPRTTKAYRTPHDVPNTPSSIICDDQSGLDTSPGGEGKDGRRSGGHSGQSLSTSLWRL